MGECSRLVDKSGHVALDACGVKNVFSPAGGAVSHSSVDKQNDLLLVDIEARLTDEVRSLVLALKQFSRGAQGIREEMRALPDADVLQRVPLAFGLMCLQLADAIEKFSDSGILLKDDVLNISRLLSHLDEAFQKVELDGKQFLAIPLCDERGGDILKSVGGGDKC